MYWIDGKEILYPCTGKLNSVSGKAVLFIGAAAYYGGMWQLVRAPAPAQRVLYGDVQHVGTLPLPDNPVTAQLVALDALCGARYCMFNKPSDKPPTSVEVAKECVITGDVMYAGPWSHEREHVHTSVGPLGWSLLHSVLGRDGVRRAVGSLKIAGVSSGGGMPGVGAVTHAILSGLYGDALPHALAEEFNNIVQPSDAYKPRPTTGGLTAGFDFWDYMGSLTGYLSFTHKV